MLRHLGRNTRKSIDGVLKGRTSALAGLISGYFLWIIAIVIQLCIVPQYLKYLGPKEFGAVVLGLSWINLSAFGTCWVAGGVTRQMGMCNGYGDRRKLLELYTCSKILYCAYTLIVSVACWSAVLISQAELGWNRDIFVFLVLLNIYFFQHNEFNTDRIALNALQQQLTINSIEVAYQIVFFLITVSCLSLGLGIKAVGIGLIIGMSCARSIVWLYWKKSSYQMSFTGIDRKILSEIWKELGGSMGKGYFVYGILALALQSDAAIIGVLAGPEAAGRFYILWRLPEAVNQLVARIPAILTPKMIFYEARGDVKKIVKLFTSGLKFSILIGALGALFYAGLGKYVLYIWVGTEAPAGIIPYMLAGAALFLVSVSQMPINTAYALLNTNRLIRTMAYYVIAKTIVSVVFVRSIGFLAPLGSTVIVGAICLWYLLKIGFDSCQAGKGA